MTDDNNSRYRSSDPFGNAPASPPAASAGQGSDPLAELARLIGKNDPFSELGRSSHAPAPPPRDAYREPHFDPAPPAHDDDHHFDSHTAAPSGWDATAQPASNFDPFAPHAVQAPMAAGTHYEDHPYAAGAHGHSQPQPVIDTYQPESEAHHDTHTGYDNENAPRLGDVPGFGPPPFHPAESGAAQPSEDQFYDDAPPRRRKGLVTVMAVLGLAVIGTAGAFGYRSYVSGGGSSLSLPPIIRASSEPNKIAPPAPQANADASKINYDRFGDRGQNEKVVPREEQPVDQREIARSSSVPRTVLPGAPTPSPNAQASSNPPSALGEPKRVRTVPIRPDQADASASPTTTVVPKQQQVAAFPAPQPVQQAPQPRQTAVAPPPMETAPAPQPERIAPQAAAPVERAPRAPRAAQPAPSGNAPLSLAPDANASLPAPAAARERAPAPAPMRVVSAPSNGGTGGYHVQVSSQRSEADAQAAFRSIQGKYSSVLGDRQAVIRRADLGEKGTYYRAMVGPFTTRDQAVQLCSSLKSAGGDCVVQSN